MYSIVGLSLWNRPNRLKSRIIGDPVGCSNGLWTVLRVEILWWLWLARLDAIYGGLKEDFGMLKDRLIKLGEGYYSRTIVEIDTRIEEITNQRQDAKSTVELESLSSKKQLLVSADLRLVLKLQYV